MLFYSDERFNDQTKHKVIRTGVDGVNRFAILEITWGEAEANTEGISEDVGLYKHQKDKGMTPITIMGKPTLRVCITRWQNATADSTYDENGNFTPQFIDLVKKSFIEINGQCMR